MTSQNGILVLGAGPNVGLSIVQRFAAQGYKTAAVARSPSEELKKVADVVISADFSKPEGIKGIFDKVTSRFGFAPGVVVYNAYAFPQGEPFEVDVAEFNKAININVTSPFAAISEAVKGFKTLPKESLKTFIFTGNAAPHLVMPPYMHLILGKRATAHIIENASLLYKDDGFRFYFGDERTPDGNPTQRDVDGPAHAEYYYELATKKEQTHEGWEQTFVKGKGYVNFEKVPEVRTN